MDRVNWSRVRDILISIICVGVLLWATGSFLGQFVHAIILLMLAMAVAFLLSPMVNFLTKYMPRILATLIVYLGVLAAMVGLSYGLVFSLIIQVQKFSDTVTRYVTVDLPKLYGDLQKFLVAQHIPQQNIDAAISQMQTQATGIAQSLVVNVPAMLLTVGDLFVNIMLVIVVSFYLTFDGHRIRDSLFHVAPKRAVPHLLIFEDALNRVVGNYLRGQLTLSFIIGLLSGLGCFLLPFGLRDYALVIGVLAFLFETIPMLGPILASIPAILISLLLPDPLHHTPWVIVYFIIIQQLENNVLAPRIVGHAVGLHPVASTFALIIGAQLFGPFGAIIATPVVATAWVVIASFYRSIRGETPEEILAKRRGIWSPRRSATRPLGDSTAASSAEHEESGQAGHPQEVPREGEHTPEKVERANLLRPVPDDQQQRRSDVGGEEE